jgi:hypothetical protein
MIRYEILLPLRYNDGSDIEEEKFRDTKVELINRFGAVTVDLIYSVGFWEHKNVVYEDVLARYRIDVEDTKQNRLFFKRYKEKLKKRFKQKEIWISAHVIEII